MCKHCTNSRKLNGIMVPESIPFRTNDNGFILATIAPKEDGDKELVVSIRGRAVGLLIKHCPMCGAKL